MVKVYVIGNFKGGVGKTKAVTMLAYQSANIKKRRTLVIDMDPQANATQILAKTGNISNIQTTITDGFKNGSLENIAINIMPNLDLIASNTAFRNLTKIVLEKFPDDEFKQINYLNHLLEPLRLEYDAIYIDVPPTISDFSDNAMLAADYCIIVLQTQELSFDGAQTYIAYMQYLADTYENNMQVLGIIPCMLRPGGRVDTKVLEDAREMYGGNVLKTIVKYQERLKVYDVEGIQLTETYMGKIDGWDQKAHEVFQDVLEELDVHEKLLETMEG